MFLLGKLYLWHCIDWIIHLFRAQKSQFWLGNLRLKRHGTLIVKKGLSG